jgi:hypothetical protein
MTPSSSTPSGQLPATEATEATDGGRSTPVAPSFRRTPAAWLTTAVAAFLLLAVVRALVDPVAFAAQFGTPLADSEDTSFVLVYAGRTAVLAAFALVMLWRHQLFALMVLVGLAIPLPVADALLAATHGAPPTGVARQAVVAVFLFLTTVLLHRAWLRAGKPVAAA